jgi:hypothetical protein
MSRIRHVGGNNIKITHGKHFIHSEDSIEFSSLKKIYDSGNTNGIIHGDFEEREIIEGEFIIDGEWLDKNGKPFDTNKTPHAKIGDEVYFRVKTKDIPIDTPLRFELWESDGITISTVIGTIFDSRMFDDFVPLHATEGGAIDVTANIDKDGYATFSLDLTEYFEGLIKDDSGSYIELYFIARYIGYDVAYLPRDAKKYLKVGYSDRTLYLQSAAENSQYGLPEFRTADGDILIFSGNVQKVGDSSFPQEEEEKSFGDRVEEKVKEHIEEKIDEKKEETIKDLLEKSRNAIAVHQLKMKKLAFNDGVVRTRSRLYSTTSFDNAGEEFTVQRASNYGFRNRATGEVVTSRGISQLDYFRETNIYSKAAKVGLHVLECLAFLDLAKFLSGNGEQGQLPGPIPALDFVIGLMLEDTKEQIKNMVDEAISVTLETAKNLGIKGIKEFISLNANDLSFSTGNVQDSKLKKYQTIDVSQTILEDILTGKIRKIETLRNRVENQNKIDRDNVLNGKTQVYTSSLKYLVLYRRENDDKINDFVNIIETIFLK